MRVAALVSTGKDSTYAMQLASEDHEVMCLGSLIPRRPGSWMFHEPRKHLLGLFARATGLPLVSRETSGVEGEELADLRRVMARMKELGAEAVVNGAVASEYQRSRVEQLCDRLGLEAISPLWGRSGEPLLREMLASGMESVVVKVAAMGLDESWLGRSIDDEAIQELVELRDSNGVHVSGEGGEYETLVTASPL